MTDRLKQIWGKFENATTRNLTGNGVDNIPRVGLDERQHQHDLMSYTENLNQNAMPQGVTEPAAAAFDALKQRLTSFDDRGRPIKRSGRHPLPEPEMQSQSFQGADMHMGQLMQDLKATEIRTTRREGDFDEWQRKMEASGELRKKRKKFLGIF